MNKSKVLNVVLVAVLIVLSVKVVSNRENTASAQNPQTVVQSSRATLDVIANRVSVREYTEQKVAKEILETIVRAGMAAPSAMNKQPWQFIIVDDADILKAIGEKIPTSSMAQRAPAGIVVCGDLSKAGQGWLEEYWIQDCSAASQNILLAVTDLGLGGVWTSIYPAEDRIKVIAEILSLPDHIIPLNIIPLGYPAGENKPKDKWSAENVHWNRW
ncbi:MAG: nitroreductase family protein [Rikenellaceae bacterium]|nr:nitroreductase family protein [Rikenellaceae bacterium]